MDKRRQALEDQLEDAQFAIFMDDYARALGEKTAEEMEQAAREGTLREIPPELDAACRDLIENAPKPASRRTQPRKVLRYTMVAAAAAVLLFASLVIVQAAGFDIFGRIATWTDSVFHFRNEPSSTEPTEPAAPENEIQAALAELGMPEYLAPTWLPEGYQLSMIQKSNTELIQNVNIQFVSDRIFPISIMITQTHDKDNISYIEWEKMDQSAVTYKNNYGTFYLFENENGWTGAWSDELYSITIIGAESIEQLKLIIDSIGEPN